MAAFAGAAHAQNPLPTGDTSVRGLRADPRALRPGEFVYQTTIERDGSVYDRRFYYVDVEQGVFCAFYRARGMK